MRRNLWFSLLSLAVVGSTYGLPFADLPFPAYASEEGPTLGADKLEALSRKIADQREKVAEFRIIRQTAQDLGLRVWLFGGTAAGFAHYVQWDMERLAGDTRYVESRFDYDFTNIYRSTQDADLVVDGSLAQVGQLESAIKTRLSHLQGAKSDWEVRTLRIDRGYKEALLNNPDFLNQHTDSNSTGMIELTDPTEGEAVVRDLRDWDALGPVQFLRDVAERKLHYYFSDRHAETKRFKDGRNPPIFSVIRYFTKAFQYELEMRPEDRERIQSIIDSFEYWRELRNQDAQLRLENIAKRLILHASNIEFALSTLEQIGLKDKLISAGNPKTVDSAAWWLSRKALASHPIGQGGGRTLEEVLVALSVDPRSTVFAHETRDFLAWESITRDTTGRPNVLISRTGFPGEAAVLGNGFYTRLGRIGARGTGFTIRFTPDLSAREGTDFFFNGEFFVWLNRAAIRVIPESLNFDLVQYLRMIAAGEVFDSNDRGIMMKLRKRIAQRQPTFNEERDAINLIQQRVDGIKAQGVAPTDQNLFAEWLTFPISANYPRPIFQLLRTADLDEKFRLELRKNLARNPHWVINDAIYENLKDCPELHQTLVEFAFGPGKRAFDEALINHLLQVKTPALDQAIIQNILSLPEAFEHPEWVKLLLNRNNPAFDRFIAQHVLSDPRWQRFPEWVLTLIRRETSDLALIEHVFSKPWIQDHPEWIDAMVRKNSRTHNDALMKNVFANSFWDDVDRWVQPMLVSDTRHFAPILIETVMPFSHSAKHPEWIDVILEYHDRSTHQLLIEHALWRKHWQEDPRWGDWVETLLKNKDLHEHLVQDLFSKPDVEMREEWMEQILKAGSVTAHSLVIELLLTQPQFKHRADVIEYFLDLGKQDVTILRHILTHPQWAGHPEWIQSLFDRTSNPLDSRLVETLNSVLTLPHWREHPTLRKACKGEAPTVERLKEAFARGAHLYHGACDRLLSSE